MKVRSAFIFHKLYLQCFKFEEKTLNYELALFHFCDFIFAYIPRLWRLLCLFYWFIYHNRTDNVTEMFFPLYTLLAVISIWSGSWNFRICCRYITACCCDNFFLSCMAADKFIMKIYKWNWIGEKGELVWIGNVILHPGPRREIDMVRGCSFNLLPCFMRHILCREP